MTFTYTAAHGPKVRKLLAKLTSASGWRPDPEVLVPGMPVLLACLMGWAGCVDLTRDDSLSLLVPPPAPEAKGPCEIEPEDHSELELPVWNLVVSQAHWDKLHEDIYADVEVPALVCVDEESYAIELELQGASTRKLPKKSFDLKWKRSHPLRTWPYDTAPAAGPVAIRKLFLKAMAKDQSLVREAISFGVYRALGYATPNTGFANLRINGEYWGLYAVIQPVNEAYLSEHGYPEGGRLYKAVRKHGSRADFAPGRDLYRAFETDLDDEASAQLGRDDAQDDPNASEEDGQSEEQTAQVEGEPNAAAERIDSEAEEEAEQFPALERAYAPLESLVRRLQKTAVTADAFETQIDPIFSLDAYIDRMIWVAFTRNGDAVAQNFFLYYTQRQDSEHWDQLPWDADITLGADYRDVESFLGAEGSPLVDGGNYFSRRLVEVPELRARYVERFVALLDDQTLEAAAFEHLAQYQQRLERDLAVDRTRWNRETTPQTAFERIADYLSQRGPVLRRALSGLGRDVEPD